MNTVDPLGTSVPAGGLVSQTRQLRDLLIGQPDRRFVMALSVLAATIFIGFLTLVLPPDSRIATVLLDRRSPHFPYPFTIQNIEHILLFLGLGELYVRWRTACHELSFLDKHLLPEDTETVLEASDLGPIRKRVAKLFDKMHGILPSLIDLSILQFQSGRSVDQTMAVTSSNLDLIQHRVDLSYSLVRYIAWVIPTMGFIGTVIGIGSALASVPAGGDVKMDALAHQLAVGFDCTMVALIESAILVFVLHIIQEKEELAVNLAGTYTLRNLINRLYNQ
ncbi:MAG TPA: MotA/TolQ/ExbB proton channel family protein [Chthoniobacterales bacterium]|jgi:biopolymer transport protein ExbB/TolQ|nr:MotA/TolQ/ExbB proton channel family protein [Chthoniobacterales bacterium]